MFQPSTPLPMPCCGGHFGKALRSSSGGEEGRKRCEEAPLCVPTLLLSYPRIGPLACNVARRNRGHGHRLQDGGCIGVTGEYERAQFNRHLNEASFEQQRAKAATNPRVCHSVSERANHPANDWL